MLIPVDPCRLACATPRLLLVLQQSHQILGLLPDMGALVDSIPIHVLEVSQCLDGVNVLTALLDHTLRACFDQTIPKTSVKATALKVRSAISAMSEQGGPQGSLEVASRTLISASVKLLTMFFTCRRSDEVCMMAVVFSRAASDNQTASRPLWCLRPGGCWEISSMCVARPRTRTPTPLEENTALDSTCVLPESQTQTTGAITGHVASTGRSAEVKYETVTQLCFRTSKTAIAYSGDIV
ncbi:hypothetical protein EYF80_018196 [Liparis tanakae]|uniref:Uncharacterized protein n=1 Tax=Liparis tanakae TaxID=230148 RepID=A0A4Z2I132_9TELE|nr:hypothetical protein EYF80_018196 [Liparis tanakae]